MSKSSETRLLRAMRICSIFLHFSACSCHRNGCKWSSHGNYKLPEGHFFGSVFRGKKKKALTEQNLFFLGLFFINEARMNMIFKGEGLRSDGKLTIVGSI